MKLDSSQKLRGCLAPEFRSDSLQRSLVPDQTSPGCGEHLVSGPISDGGRGEEASSYSWLGVAKRYVFLERIEKARAEAESASLQLWNAFGHLYVFYANIYCAFNQKQIFTILIATVLGAYTHPSSNTEHLPKEIHTRRPIGNELAREKSVLSTIKDTFLLVFLNLCQLSKNKISAAGLSRPTHKRFTELLYPLS